MTNKLLSLLLLLGACNVNVNAPVSTPDTDGPIQARIAPPEETPEVLDPSTFKLPRYAVYSVGTRLTACDASPQWQANVGLFKVTCIMPSQSQYGVNLTNEGLEWIRTYLGNQGLVEDEHYELDTLATGGVHKIIIYILDSEYTGLVQESFDASL